MRFRIRLVCTGCRPPGEQLIFAFLPITLPVLAAALICLVSINDLQRRVARYREMLVILTEGRTQLMHAALLAQLGAWRCAHRTGNATGSARVAFNHEF
jgi:hypothetical protein